MSFDIKKNYFALLGIVLVIFIAHLDYTIINTALPTLQSVFSVSILELQWVFNIYSIILAIFMVVAGRLGDAVGRRKIFYLGIFLLGIGSLGAGLSNNFATLLLFRGVQSLGVAATVILGASLVNHIFKDKAHMPMSIYAISTGLGMTVGPFIGGVIVMYCGWRWIFLINIPLLAVAVMFCISTLPEFKSGSKVQVDFIGAFLLAISLTSLIYGLFRGEQQGWLTSTCMSCTIIFVMSTLFLAWYENRQLQPILNFHFFSKPTFLLASLACIMCGVLISPAILFSPLFLQNILKFTPQQAGSLLLILPIGIIVFSPLIGKVAPKITAAKMLYIGLLISILASIFYLLFSVNLSTTIILIAFIFTGFSWAITNTTAAISAISSIAPAESGVAIGTIFSFWNVSAAISIVVTTVIFNEFYRETIKYNDLAVSFIAGFRYVFIFVGIVTAIIALIATITLLAKNRPLLSGSPE